MTVSPSSRSSGSSAPEPGRCTTRAPATRPTGTGAVTVPERSALGRVKTPQLRNPLGSPGVVPSMDPITVAPVCEPGLVAVAAADDDTELAFQ